MRAIKILVAFMGVLIIAGVALVGYGVSRQDNAVIVSDDAKLSAPIAGLAEPQATRAMTVGDQLAPFGTIDVKLAPGETLVDFARNGAEATLRLEGRHGSRLVIVSLRDGSVLGQIRMVDPQ
ncbi:hypothetical protein [Thalassospira alkalitolerans]|uniref:hypothetical protein n=1 Tax=Thalassospira alkalitolerans TaxID=1293890 RepID=UPI003AA81781|tara:strand:- start:182263 stop:182628 length:366 start_codon:yes stop_codon:yes gene_type:complete